MDTELWFPVVTLLVGHGAGYLIDWHKARRAERPDRSNRWHAFQRDKLTKHQALAEPPLLTSHGERPPVFNPEALWVGCLFITGQSLQFPTQATQGSQAWCPCKELEVQPLTVCVQEAAQLVGIRYIAARQFCGSACSGIAALRGGRPQLTMVLSLQGPSRK
jgi:hypothetical protein